MTATRIAGEPDSELSYYPEDSQAQAGRDALNAELVELRKETKGKMFGESVNAG
jgi:hypothetical protein